MRKNKVIALVLAALFCFPNFVLAQDTSEKMKEEMDSLKARLAELEEKLEKKPVEGAKGEKADEKAAVPSLGEVLGSTGITLTGYIDTTYSHLSGNGRFNLTPSGPGVTPGGFNRVFDFERDSFNLQQVAASAAYQPEEGFGAFANITLGKDADVIAAFDTDGLFTNGDKDYFDVTQAFVQYAKGPFTLAGGKFVTLAGAEVIWTPLDVNLSRSILFGYAIPFTHTGVRAKYVAGEVATFSAGINNGWDAVKDTNNQKTFELGAFFTPTKSLAFSVAGYTGEERVGGLVNIGPNGNRNLIDLLATWNLTDQLQFVVNYDYGSQENFTSLVNGSNIKAKWNGIAGYINYLITEQWRLSLRGEYFDDEDGYRTGIIQEWKEATLTLSWLPHKNFELRAEVRGDKSNEDVFINPGGTSADDTQQSYGLQALFKF
ncbi:MAG: outer membrane beta-barrel protein [Burkholderiales bacterium]